MSTPGLNRYAIRSSLIGLSLVLGIEAISRTDAQAREADLAQRPGAVQVEVNRGVNPEKSGTSRRNSIPRSPQTQPRNVDPDHAAGSDKSSEVKGVLNLIPEGSRQTVQTLAIFAIASMVPAALMMMTAFVRINIVLMLLRQALGSPQIPGNQVLTALAFMLTMIVMEPVGERIYRDALVPLSAQKIGFEEAVQKGIRPVKIFMADQIIRTRHKHYLLALYEEAVPQSEGQAEPEFGEDFPFRVLAPAFLLSELTSALMMGFFLYLPFLVIDLVVSSVLAAIGLYMLPPTTVAMPLKLILFVLADGWLLVSRSLLASFSTGTTPI
jgi:flagellar biosynthetic protein FliP